MNSLTAATTAVSLPPMFIVEDDDHFRETFIDVMSLKGVPASGARTGSEALQSLREEHPAVIVMDVQLPDVHGFDLCRKLKRMPGYENVPVIFISACTQYSDVRDRNEALEAGGAMFIPKPMTMDHLWAAVEQLLASQGDSYRKTP